MKHVPVLQTEVLHFLNVMNDRVYVDATFGAGGYTRAILKQGGKVIAFDQDKTAIDAGKTNFSEFVTSGQLKLVNQNFRFLARELDQIGVREVSGVVFDFGFSSDQLDDANRGFSFRLDGEIDMRMDKSLAVKASDLINGLTEKELAELFIRLGDVPYAGRVAGVITAARKSQPITTTNQLVAVIEKAYGPKWPRSIHPATQIFQALRIAVNDELTAIKEGLEQAIDTVVSGGVIAAVSFHSLEDRLVKDGFRDDLRVQVLTKRPITPSAVELETNSRAGSAKLRVAKKI